MLDEYDFSQGVRGKYANRDADVTSVETVQKLAEVGTRCDNGSMEERVMTLTSDQRTAIETIGSVPLTVDGLECVLVRSDVFERVRNLIGGEWTDDQMLMMLARASKENGWDEPGMELYDEYEKHAPEPR